MLFSILNFSVVWVGTFHRTHPGGGAVKGHRLGGAVFGALQSGDCAPNGACVHCGIASLDRVCRYDVVCGIVSYTYRTYILAHLN